MTEMEEPRHTLDDLIHAPSQFQTDNPELSCWLRPGVIAPQSECDLNVRPDNAKYRVSVWFGSRSGTGMALERRLDRIGENGTPCRCKKRCLCKKRCQRKIEMSYSLQSRNVRFSLDG